MPTPYGSRGGMAFGVEELRVLRRALALALHPSPASAEDVQDCLHLAETLDEAMREGARLRAFLVADLARYRAALPGASAGYLRLLKEALGAGHRPTPDDLTALRALRGNPAAAALLDRCRPRPLTPAIPAPAPVPTAVTTVTATPTPAPPPTSRTRLLALPGGLDDAAKDPGKKPAEKPAPKPARKPAPAPASPPTPAPPKPTRPIPTPGEVFPRRKPTPPPADPQQLVAG